MYQTAGLDEFRTAFVIVNGVIKPLEAASVTRFQGARVISAGQGRKRKRSRENVRNVVQQEPAKRRGDMPDNGVHLPVANRYGFRALRSRGNADADAAPGGGGESGVAVAKAKAAASRGDGGDCRDAASIAAASPGGGVAAVDSRHFSVNVGNKAGDGVAAGSVVVRPVEDGVGDSGDGNDDTAESAAVTAAVCGGNGTPGGGVDESFAIVGTGAAADAAGVDVTAAEVAGAVAGAFKPRDVHTATKPEASGGEEGGFDDSVPDSIPAFYQKENDLMQKAAAFQNRHVATEASEEGLVKSVLPPIDKVYREQENDFEVWEYLRSVGIPKAHRLNIFFFVNGREKSFFNDERRMIWARAVYEKLNGGSLDRLKALVGEPLYKTWEAQVEREESLSHGEDGSTKKKPSTIRTNLEGEAKKWRFCFKPAVMRAVGMAWFNEKNSELKYRGYCILDHVFDDGVVPLSVLRGQRIEGYRRFLPGQPRSTSVMETWQQGGQKMFEAFEKCVNSDLLNQDESYLFSAIHNSGKRALDKKFCRYMSTNYCVMSYLESGSSGHLNKLFAARMLVDFRIGQLMALLLRCSDPVFSSSPKDAMPMMPATGGRWIVTGEECPVQQLHTDYSPLSFDNDGNVPARGYFVVCTGTEPAVLYVSELPVCVVRDAMEADQRDGSSQRMEGLGRGSFIKRLEIPPLSMFVGDGCLIHGGASWNDYQRLNGSWKKEGKALDRAALTLRYHSYFSYPSSPSVRNAVYLLPGFKPEMPESRAPVV